MNLREKWWFGFIIVYFTIIYGLNKTSKFFNYFFFHQLLRNMKNDETVEERWIGNDEWWNFYLIYSLRNYIFICFDYVLFEILFWYICLNDDFSEKIMIWFNVSLNFKWVFFVNLSMKWFNSMFFSKKISWKISLINNYFFIHFCWLFLIIICSTFFAVKLSLVTVTKQITDGSVDIFQ